MVRSFDGLRNIAQSFALALAGRIREQQRTKPTGLPIVLIATLSPVDRRRSGGRCLELHRPRRREFEFLLREEVWRGIQSVLVGKTAGDWTCQQSKNNRRPISVEKACKMQYGKSGQGEGPCLERSALLALLRQSRRNNESRSALFAEPVPLPRLHVEMEVVLVRLVGGWA
jgi:hypothetical protein